MPVTVIDARTPKIIEPPPIRPLVLCWRPGDYNWINSVYSISPNETQKQAAISCADRRAEEGYHVRIVEVDE